MCDKFSSGTINRKQTNNHPQNFDLYHFQYKPGVPVIKRPSTRQKASLMASLGLNQGRQ